LASFTLNVVGETHTFDFFDIWTHESDYDTDEGVPGGGNDATHRSIEATLDMTPADAPIVITGETYASTAGGAHGVVAWAGPVTVTAGLCTYTVTLSDRTFNWGCGEDFGGTGNDGWDGRAIVTATVELTYCDPSGEQDPIAEPSGLSFIGLALLAVRKRRS